MSRAKTTLWLALEMTTFSILSFMNLKNPKKKGKIKKKEKRKKENTKI